MRRDIRSGFGKALPVFSGMRCKSLDGHGAVRASSAELLVARGTCLVIDSKVI